MNESAIEATRALRRKLDAAALEALEAGFDWCEAEEIEQDDYFTPRPLWEPLVVEISVKAGPIAAGSAIPSGYRVIRHSDWIKAGRPGVHEAAA